MNGFLSYREGIYGEGRGRRVMSNYMFPEFRRFKKGHFSWDPEYIFDIDKDYNTSCYIDLFYKLK